MAVFLPDSSESGRITQFFCFGEVSYAMVVDVGSAGPADVRLCGGGGCCLWRQRIFRSGRCADGGAILNFSSAATLAPLQPSAGQDAPPLRLRQIDTQTEAVVGQNAPSLRLRQIDAQTEAVVGQDGASLRLRQIDKQDNTVSGQDNASIRLRQIDKQTEAVLGQDNASIRLRQINEQDNTVSGQDGASLRLRQIDKQDNTVVEFIEFVWRADV